MGTVSRQSSLLFAPVYCHSHTHTVWCGSMHLFILNEYVAYPVNRINNNKATLRDLKAATGLVILLRLDSTRRLFARVTFKIDGWHPKNNKARLLKYIKLCASFCSHWWIQTGVIVLKRPIWVKIDDFLQCVLAIWPMTLKNNREPLLCYFKLCVSFRRHWWLQTGVTVRKRPKMGQIRRFF